MIFTPNLFTIAGTAYGMVLADRDTVPTAYAPATVQWSAPTGLDNPDPATLTIDVTVPVGYPRPQLNDPVVLAVDVWPGSGDTVFYGAVDTLRRTVREFRNADGSTFEVEVLRVTAIDWLGVLARRRIGDEPWPLESWAARALRIAALTADLPWATLPTDPTAQPQVAPRDIDATSALDVLRDTIAGAGKIVTSERDGLRIADRPTWYPNQIVIHGAVGVGQAVVVPGGAAPFSVDARYVYDQDRVLDFDLIVNRTSVGYKVPPDDPEGDWSDSSVVYRDEASIQAYGETEWTIRSDAVDPAPMAQVARWAVGTAAQPRWRLDGALEFDLNQDRLIGHAPDFVYVVSTDYRHGMVAYIPDAPEDDLRAVRIIGGTLTLGSDQDEALLLTPENFDFAAPRGLIFGDAHAWDWRFNEAENVTFDDVRTATYLTRETP